LVVVSTRKLECATSITSTTSSGLTEVGLQPAGQKIRLNIFGPVGTPAWFGMEVELTMIPFATDADGNEIITFAFQPV